jgi:geranylgeranyl pyrophosphate synthase
MTASRSGSPRGRSDDNGAYSDVGRFQERVRRIVADRLKAAASSLGAAGEVVGLVHGKMLRTRFAGKLAAAVATPPAGATLARACAAVEMVHTASLYHDDVIDSGLIRRARPTLWRTTGASAAVLIGDILLCEAMGLLLDTEGGRHVRPFVAKVSEVCLGEAEQEFVLRGRQWDEETCLRIARAKTGPLFAFGAGVSGGADRDLCRALEEAGYRIGTAYQLADDLLDVLGREDVAGKTLGTDGARGKFTLAHASKEGRRSIAGHIARQCGSGLDCLARWPAARDTLAGFIACDLLPLFCRCELGLERCLSFAS